MILLQKLTEDLKTSHRELLEKGELLSKEKLAEYYTTFRQRFGPQLHRKDQHFSV